jgi:hypothetical protein
MDSSADYVEKFKSLSDEELATEHQKLSELIATIGSETFSVGHSDDARKGIKNERDLYIQRLNLVQAELDARKSISDADSQRLDDGAEPVPFREPQEKKGFLDLIESKSGVSGSSLIGKTERTDKHEEE